MSAFSHLRKRFKKLAKGAAKVAVPIHSKGAVRSVVHGVEKYGKTVGGLYTLSAGLPGALIVKHNPKHFGKGAATIAGKIVPIEKVGLGVAGGMVAGGVGASIGQKIAGSFDPSSVSSGVGGTGGSAQSQAFSGPGASSSATMWLVAGGSVLLVVVLIVATKKRRK